MNTRRSLFYSFAVAVFGQFALAAILALVPPFGATAAAAPQIFSYGHFTDRYPVNSIPGFPVGDKVQVNTIFDSTDPVASPTITVNATQDDATLALDFSTSTVQLYPGWHVYTKIFDFDPDLLGPWEISPTDSTGTGPSVFTNSIVEPEFLPWVENVAVRGTASRATVSWSLPSLNGYDPDFIFVRVVEAATGLQVDQSAGLSLQTSSYTSSAGILKNGVAYAFRIMLTDAEGDFNENRSNTFSVPFRLTISGDYNQNGTVDTADYTVWRDNLGGGALLNRGVGVTGPVGAADYEIWRSNFGQSLGAASRTAPAVPEPATIVILLLAAGMPARRHRTREFVPEHLSAPANFGTREERLR